MRSDVKPRTVINYRQAAGNIREFFGTDKALAEITAGDADEFRLWMLERLGENTVRRHCGRANQFLEAAVRKGWLTRNPFGDLKGCQVRENRSRDYFVTLDEAAKVLVACPSTEWRLIFALCRFAGLRCPSEVLALKWGDVNWEQGRLRVPSPKTERHEGKGERVIPIFPESLPCLETAFDEAPEGRSSSSPAAAIRESI